MRRLATRFLSLAALTAFATHSCAADPDLTEGPGICQLNCSGARIASSEMDIRFFPETFTINCAGIAADQEYIGTVPIRFVAERARVELPAETGPGPTGGAAEAPPTDPRVVGTPVPGISYEALIVAGQMSTEDNPDDDRYKYRGIKTPKSEWCTDSCGYGTIDVVPMCKSVDQDVTILIHSGPLAKSITFKVKAPS